MIVQLSHPQRQVEIKGPKRSKEVLRELNLVIEAHLVIRGDDLVTEDEMLADADQSKSGRSFPAVDRPGFLTLSRGTDIHELREV